MEDWIHGWIIIFIYKNNTFKIKMKEDVGLGMSKPKKHAEKVGIVITQEVNVGPKITSMFNYVGVYIWKWFV